jgi:hypothetical protein
MRTHMKIYVRTQPLATRHHSSDYDEVLQTRTKQDWHRERSPSGPLVASHRMPHGPRHRSFDFTTTNNPRQTHGHAGEEPTTATKATSSISLHTTIVAIEVSRQTHRRPACRCPAPKTKPPRGNTTPMCHHHLIKRIKDFPWSYTVDQICARGVQKQYNDASRKVNDGRGPSLVQHRSETWSFTQASITPSSTQQPPPALTSQSATSTIESACRQREPTSPHDCCVLQMQ